MIDNETLYQLLKGDKQTLLAEINHLLQLNLEQKNQSVDDIVEQYISMLNENISLDKFHLAEVCQLLEKLEEFEESIGKSLGYMRGESMQYFNVALAIRFILEQHIYNLVGIPYDNSSQSYDKSKLSDDQIMNILSGLFDRMNHKDFSSITQINQVFKFFNLGLDDCYDMLNSIMGELLEIQDDNIYSTTH
ncbi:hypothetical protein L3V82_13145 [Thiotrichales bacterium 19S3-7]|nr:hypothetical protein [Thiotrichales bacterium 19S3-7]MCF6803115.1 hypothetical protein [Thiotrichales bacterium 19S3-11]